MSNCSKMMKRLCLFVLLLLVGASLRADPESPDVTDAHVAHLSVNGAIGPATTDYLTSTLAEAKKRGARAVVIEIDTPGGLDAATRDIVQALLASSIPVMTYVHPAGARAASAGTYILYASHLAAMTPATTLGAATPVRLTGSAGERGNVAETGESEPENPSTASENDGDRKGSQSPVAESAMERKVVNDAVAFIRGLAARHNRNADWAERAVREAVSLTATEALNKNVVDILAIDVNDLLLQAHGRKVQMDRGTETLALEGLPVKQYAPTWRNKLLALITNPQIAYILLLVGIYGLIFEGYSPGAMVPGVVGIISLLLAFYALQVLPISYAGLALIILGAVLIGAEAFVPSFGVLGIGGVISLVVGSVMLIDTEVPGMMVSTELIAAIGAVTSLLVLGILVFVGRSLRLPRPAVNKEMVGREALVVHCDANHYQIRVHGELWHAESTEVLRPGQSVRITGQHGLNLRVEPINANEESL